MFLLVLVTSDTIKGTMAVLINLANSSLNATESLWLVKLSCFSNRESFYITDLRIMFTKVIITEARIENDYPFT